MFSLIANNRKKIESPSSWEETTTETYQAIIRDWDMDKPLKERDKVKLFSIINKMDYDSIVEADESEIMPLIEAVCAYVYYTDLPNEIPKTISINGRELAIPKNLNGMTIGQGIHIKEVMDKHKDLREIISFACAIYLQPFYDNAKFDLTRARELEESILKMPITLTYPVGFFLLTKLKDYGMTATRNLHLAKLQMPNWKQKLVAWLDLKGFNHTITLALLMCIVRSLALTQM